MNEVLEKDIVQNIKSNFTTPLFIVGSPRSGTTLLQALVCSTDEYEIPPEEDFIIRLYDKYIGTRSFDDDVLDGFVDDLCASTTFMNWDLDTGYLREVISLCKVESYADLVRSVYIAYAAKTRSGKSEWGSKVPYFVNHIDRISRLLPSAKFIHLVRDGRDVLCSMRAREKKGETHFETRTVLAALQWKSMVTRGIRYGAALPQDQFLSLRYEDLVTKPDEVLEVVSRFLDCDMSSAAEKFYKSFIGNEASPIDNMERYLRPNITGDHVERWRNILSSQELLDYEMVAAELLEDRGYNLQFRPLPVSRRIRGSLVRSIYGLYGSMPTAMKSLIRK